MCLPCELASPLCQLRGEERLYIQHPHAPPYPPINTLSTTACLHLHNHSHILAGTMLEQPFVSFPSSINRKGNRTSRYVARLPAFRGGEVAPVFLQSSTWKVTDGRTAVATFHGKSSEVKKSRTVGHMEILALRTTKDDSLSHKPPSTLTGGQN